MKIYIQSNKYQLIAAKVAQFSFEQFGCDVKIMEIENYQNILNKFNRHIKRNGKLSFFEDDLQSFTLLRFLAPELNKFKDKILIIDPDIFALKDPKNLINELNEDKFDIGCTFYNNLPRSEMMIVDAKKVNWNFKKILDNLFDLKIDYKDLMNLSFDEELKIKNIDKKYNSHDIIEKNTILLHTTNRITQPWKLDLKIDFKRYYSKKYLFKNNLKKIFFLPYDKKAVSKNYVPHVDKNVFKIVSKLFYSAYKAGYIDKKMIDQSITEKFISKKFCKISNLI